MTLTVNEIFHSIQGESTFAGRPCVFVRLTGCDLRCVWCDTAYAYHEGAPLSVGEILAAVARYDCPLVEVTGGEPLLQAGTPLLLTALVERGYEVLLETGGHCDIAGVDPRVIRIVDLKCPDSGMCGRNRWANLASLTASDEVKCVLASRADYEWAREQVRRHDLAGKARAVLFSTVSGRLDPRQLAEWLLADRLPVRMQLQLHKYIWPRQQRGV
ncbi:MAG: 7-carboxy-7-deazaguanine synthase QueE [Verrucomicrobiales bacterium]|jgi:7-carboxy-7-deazaguanine synthase|nr:7-carboxy-7-deazaguanine synthase QueE [Verrucomicrobiales bacterium]